MSKHSVFEVFCSVNLFTPFNDGENW